MKTLAILCFVLGFAMLAWVAFHDKLEGLFPDSSETETTAIQEEENREEVQNQDTNPKSETVSDNQEDSGDRVMVVSKEFLESLVEEEELEETPQKSIDELSFEYAEQAHSNARTEDEFQEVFERFNRLAESGHEKSILKLAYMHGRGEGTERDLEKAFSLLKSIAEKGNLVAQNQVAWRLEYGLGTEKNPEEAYVWYQRAADKGFPDATAHLGRHISIGTLGAPDPHLGFGFYKRAEKARSAWGAFYMAKAMLEGNGTRQNIEAGISLLERLGNKNFVEAQSWLFISYLKGKWTEKDLDEAHHWLSMAASDRGAVVQLLLIAQKFDDEIEAEHVREMIDHLGEPVPNKHRNWIAALHKNRFKRAESMEGKENAIEWLKLAADLGHSIAQLQYAYGLAAKYEHTKDPQAYEAAISALEMDPAHSKATYALKLHKNEEMDLKAAIRKATESDYVERQNYGADIQIHEDLDRQPRATKAVQPVYPPHLKKERITGSVVIVMIIDEEGLPNQVSIENSTHEAFSTAAIEAARQWRFEPGMKDGNPVKTRVRLPLSFELMGGSLPDLDELE